MKIPITIAHRTVEVPVTVKDDLRFSAEAEEAFLRLSKADESIVAHLEGRQLLSEDDWVMFTDMRNKAAEDIRRMGIIPLCSMVGRYDAPETCAPAT